MSTREVNPNNPTLAAVRDKWPWLFAVLMRKQGKASVRITLNDLVEFGNANLAIAVRGNPDDLEIFLVDEAAAEALGRKEGGMPV